MSFLKKTFGKPDPKKDKQVEEDLAQIKAGKIKKIYPILEPGDWVGLNVKAPVTLRPPFVDAMIRLEIIFLESG